MLDDFRVGPSILMYHSIGGYPDDKYSVRVDAFREQLCWLFEHGFETISLQLLLRMIQAGHCRGLGKKVALTFDDGYKDFIDNALPVLLEYNAPATVFLVTGLLGTGASWAGSGARLMSEEEARHIKAKGVSLGSHTASHANLLLLSEEEMVRQLMDSRQKLTELGESFFPFSYPWGRWSRPVADAVKAAGFECAVAVDGHLRAARADAYRLPRITMTCEMDLCHLRSRLTRTAAEVAMRRKCRAMLDFVSQRPKRRTT